MWGLIPGSWDHDLSQRQLLNPLSHPGAPVITFIAAAAVRKRDAWSNYFISMNLQSFCSAASGLPLGAMPLNLPPESNLI